MMRVVGAERAARWLCFRRAAAKAGSPSRHAEEPGEMRGPHSLSGWLIAMARVEVGEAASFI